MYIINKIKKKKYTETYEHHQENKIQTGRVFTKLEESKKSHWSRKNRSDSMSFHLGSETH